MLTAVKRCASNCARVWLLCDKNLILSNMCKSHVIAMKQQRQRKYWEADIMSFLLLTKFRAFKSQAHTRKLEWLRFSRLWQPTSTIDSMLRQMPIDGRRFGNKYVTITHCDVGWRTEASSSLVERWVVAEAGGRRWLHVLKKDSNFVYRISQRHSLTFANCLLFYGPCHSFFTRSFSQKNCNRQQLTHSNPNFIP